MNLEGHGMAVTQLDPVLHHIRRLAFAANPNDPTDGQLLEQYHLGGSQEAFAVLVRRHGPMVLGVCRRILRTVPDAEDAFQATFLLLVRNAARIVNRESVGSWLHGVAYRTSLKAKSAARRRRTVERQAPVVAAVEERPEVLWRDLRPLLDEEIGRLPERYRLPLVLCYLEGKTNTEAAQLLRWPKGTVATRLARARQQLRNRLTQRGAALSAAGLGVAAVPSSLRASVVQAAVRIAAGQTALAGVVSERAIILAKGVLRTMTMTKMRLLAVVVLAIGTAGGGAGWLLHRAATTANVFAGQEATKAEARPINSRGPEEEREEHVFHLLNVAAADAANAVLRYLAEQEPELKDKAVLRSEPITNQLRISAPAGKFEQIQRLIKELDAEPHQIIIQALVMEVGADGEKEILSRPQIMTSDNQLAHVFVGQMYPIVSGTFVDAEGVEQAKFEEVPVGVALEVTPRIEPDGKIILRVHVTSTQPHQTKVELGDGLTATAFNSQSLEQTIEATDGEAVTIHELPRTGTRVTEYKLPVLSALPFVGDLFRYRLSSPENRELRVVLVPHLVRNRTEAVQILTEEAKKTDRLIEPKSTALPD
jgi:RNA polymerase sigma factor (sigma-70 family)